MKMGPRDDDNEVEGSVEEDVHALPFPLPFPPLRFGMV